ncbi:MAG TPA: hypothetical protein VGK32_06065 [Vicinamibacterales bacterium]|jgi:predicted nucleic acid-binding protein
MRAVIERGERVSLSTLVLYEWLRGPRHAEELRAQEAALWTLNPRDFADIPGLRILEPSPR